MVGVNGREHFLLAKEFVVVLFGLWIEPRIVIGIEGLRAGRARIKRLIQTAQASRAGLPGPGIVAMSRIGITIPQQAAPATILSRELRAKQKQPYPLRILTS